MRTGTTRPHRRPALLFVALFAALSLLSLAGCAGSSPVAVPTSTLPEEQPDDSSTDGTAEVEVPEYETDLDLSEEEKEAVDGALVAFAGYFQTVNQAYAGDFSAANRFQEYASGDALKSIKGDVAVIKDGSYNFSGTIVPSNIEVYKVGPRGEAKSTNSVTVLFCFDLSKWSLLPKDESSDSEDSGFVTMEHSIRKQSDRWTVAEQSLRERKC